MASLSEVLNISYVKTVLASLAVTTLISYLVYNNQIDIVSLSIMVILTCLTAWGLSSQFPKRTVLNHFIVGVLSYGAYVFALLFFKITENVPSMNEEIMTAIIFGVISGAAFWALDRR
jgi:hypothetical protein